MLDHFDVRRGVVVARSTGGIGALALAVGSADRRRGRLAGQVLLQRTERARRHLKNRRAA